ncbi:MAG: hypothetical protein HYT36_01490 [Candidatus Staskawiczbacteria bacterium]|nr:hypothetical protein [Candidatus Staskawiczbacteria bacterium]
MTEGTAQITKKEIQELLREQTTVILDAVDEKLSGVKINMVDLEERIEKKIETLDLKFTEKFDKLATSLDNFLKRLIDKEDEFTIIKEDINKMKKVIKEKLGVDLA